MTKARGCIFQITNKVCIIQDRTTLTLIGAGREQNGLYFFRGMETAASMSRMDSTSTQLGHCRLGHASSKALQLLKVSDISISDFYSKTCKILFKLNKQGIHFS